MVKSQFAIAFAATALAFALTTHSAWCATPSPSLIATPPQPKWTELTVQQRVVLAPLSDEWDSMEYYRQKKWLGIALRFLPQFVSSFTSPCSAARSGYNIPSAPS